MMSFHLWITLTTTFPAVQYLKSITYMEATFQSPRSSWVNYKWHFLSYLFLSGHTHSSFIEFPSFSVKDATLSPVIWLSKILRIEPWFFKLFFYSFELLLTLFVWGTQVLKRRLWMLYWWCLLFYFFQELSRSYSRAHLFIFSFIPFLMQPQNRKNRQLRLKKLRKGKASLLNMSVKKGSAALSLDDKLFVQQRNSSAAACFCCSEKSTAHIQPINATVVCFHPWRQGQTGRCSKP